MISEGLLKNVTQITLSGKMSDSNTISDKKIKLVPYYSWNNRGDSTMIVWFPTAADMIPK